MIATARLSRRTLLRSTGLLAGTAFVSRFAPAGLLAHVPSPQTVPDIDAMRAEMGKAPIQRASLGDRVELLSGPGGNVAVLHGPDGLVLVDNFVRPAWSQLQAALAAIGPKVATAIDTHWHFDHADNNASLRKAGAAILAHANTKTRLSEKQQILGMSVGPEPPDALPTVTFKDSHTFRANGEDVVLQYIQPAHTDTDIAILFNKANVLHLGDLFFNGMYPFIDASTGGNINGMIAAAERALGMADANTKIVPGHGPMADRAALQRYRGVLSQVRDKVGALKASGRSLAETQAAKPGGAFDADWGNGFMKPDDFVALVYNTLP